MHCNRQDLAGSPVKCFIRKSLEFTVMSSWILDIRVSQNAPFSVKHSMTGDKRKLKWRRVRKYIRSLILFIPRASNRKKPFRGFSGILLHNISYEFTSFFLLWPNQKIHVFLWFSAAFLIDCAQCKQTCACA